MYTLLKGNLVTSHNHMKKYADLKRCERSFEVGEMVYLKLVQVEFYFFKETFETLSQILQPIQDFGVCWHGGLLTGIIGILSGLSSLPRLFVKKCIKRAALPIPDLPVTDIDGGICSSARDRIRFLFCIAWWRRYSASFSDAGKFVC